MAPRDDRRAPDARKPQARPFEDRERIVKTVTPRGSKWLTRFLAELSALSAKEAARAVVTLGKWSAVAALGSLAKPWLGLLCGWHLLAAACAAW
jgi:hypothetical protein